MIPDTLLLYDQEVCFIGVMGLTSSATARAISGGDSDYHDEMSDSIMEDTGVLDDTPDLRQVTDKLSHTPNPGRSGVKPGDPRRHHESNALSHSATEDPRHGHLKSS